ncbi:MAG: hypothetical protein LBT62_08355 [Deltaproteobacteria bacterium]|jgi:hypothetical protein|nr:hypothetical protein [Deltaproteobacteria bacterium]
MSKKIFTGDKEIPEGMTMIDESSYFFRDVPHDREIPEGMTIEEYLRTHRSKSQQEFYDLQKKIEEEREKEKK